jgi:hypothetical protein
MFFTTNYTDFKNIAAQFTSGKVLFFNGTGSFKIYGMASGFPVLVCSLNTQPGTFATDFPAAVSLSTNLLTDLG